MTPKVLIATAWWPTKTPCFDRWSRGVVQQLGDIDTELFITTRYADSKFRSIVEALVQAQEWASAHGFTHIFNVEADKEVMPGSLRRLLSLDRPVVLMGRGSGSGVSPVSLRELDLGYGWGAMLVQMSVLSKVPFASAMAGGDFNTPDRMWFKRLLQFNVPICVDHDCPVITMESAAVGPQSGFLEP